ncbi:MAG: leucine--tRNA ligase [Candidatus Micrarchaeota archaeon]|nr:leucine--tRNA ligase [Candidatus Micrarchaeota archaeon]
MINYKEIETKWQARWSSARIFEGEISDKPAYMVTAAWPYTNAPQHVGHLRTFGTTDVLARYMRMKGYNTLYPMAFHATGTPILAFAKRLKNNDQDLISELHMFHVPDDEIQKMTDPMYIASYFIDEIEKGMKKAGYSIDWRRKFVSVEPLFSKFVEWQFGILNEKGYIVKGKHPVGWCPNENNAVGMHDTKHDVEPEIDKETAIKFKIDGEDAYLLCTTYRPETIFGVTNVFVNSDVVYALCKVNDEPIPYYMSKATSQMLSYQLKIERISEVKGADLLQRMCLNPINGAKIPVLPGFFVKEDIGTGIVMSVPAHAPFDYVALEKLRSSGYSMPEIKPVKVLEVKKAGAAAEEPYVDMPALAYINLFSKGEKELDAALEEATKAEYKDESHFGVMIVEGYKGMGEMQAREKITADMVKACSAFEIYVIVNNPVFCRCGYRVTVKLVDNQWFINYGDHAWKDRAREAFMSMTILPEKSRKAFESAIDWIDLRATERAQGLGTKFPLNEDHIIESLSDSTIYMSFYTISYLVRSIPIENLKPAFFDYVFLKKGNIDEVSKATGISYETIKRCRESFSYWYPNTSRHSGPDLIFNHLTMYIFNHVAVFHKEYWPKQIVVNGSVLSEGEKMSKSLGNIVPLMDGMEKYGADPLRFVVVAGADLFSDSEFSAEAVRGVDERLEYLYDLARRIDEFESGELKHIDYWLYSKLNRKIRAVTQSIDKLELRGVSTLALYDSIIELKRYLARGGGNGLALRDYVTNVTMLLAPIVPHFSEELWEMLGNGPFVATERWPSADESMISDKIESEEELLDSVIGDSKQVLDLLRKKTGKEPAELVLIVADNWKTMLNNRLAREKNTGKVIKELNLEDEMFKGVDKDRVMKYVNQLLRKRNTLRIISTDQEEEFRLLNESKLYIESVLRCRPVIEKEGSAKSQRAALAMPQRPAIDART